jgi:hypothetical protein
MGKYNTTLRTGNLSLRGRGMENTSAATCRELGFVVDQASESNKFVQVRGPSGTTLVAFYADWGGFQLQVAAEALVASLIADLKGIGVFARPAPGDRTGLRVAIGGDKADLKAALALVIGEVGEKVEKVEVAAPLAAIQAPVIQAPSLDVGAIVVAALAAGKTNEEVIALIAALKA